MSEPTYRIELSHHPENGTAVSWTAVVYAVADESYHIFDCFAATREAAFDKAQTWCRAKASEPQAPSTVFLTEDGDIHDPHEVQA